ncbi:preprotein translocase subunit SecE [Melghirimyces profundicolus]|uniref:Protein translocase subunit SecE n=1 Tax=Melghirimyces profundicolus TaxID=1242148 RepID=A0A2T6BPY8_9BACL|nr:preprotein translocase subunit SecE [Melghirimyces profundicolus]PTX58160.1 preprotein translocase subunit SecE [Melghirimyces profundicolus]
MGFLGRIGSGIKRSVTGTANFISTGVAELKKVRWPSRQELFKYTLVVLITVIFVTLFTVIIDLGIANLVERIT